MNVEVNLVSTAGLVQTWLTATTAAAQRPMSARTVKKVITTYQFYSFYDIVKGSVTVGYYLYTAGLSAYLQKFNKVKIYKTTY